MNTKTCEIYVASLAKYNAGVLDGVWITCNDKDADDLKTEIQTWLDADETRGEEWAIHDAEFCGWELGETTSLEVIADVVELMDKHDPDLVAELLSQHSAQDLDHVKKLLTDGYIGSYESKEAWAEEALAETLSAIPADLQRYFDLEAYAKDQELSGDLEFVASGGVIHVLSNHV